MFYTKVNLIVSSMYYSSDSSDSDGQGRPVVCRSLDLSYLLLDSHSVGEHLKNSVHEQHVASKVNQEKGNIPQQSSPPICDTMVPISENWNHDASVVRRPRNIIRQKSVEEEERTVYDNVTEKLFLQHNLMFTIPFEVISFGNLKKLDLSNNNLTHINEFLLQLPNIESLYIKNNNLGNDAFPKDLQSLTKLRELNLSGNQLTRVPPQLYEMTSIKYLYLGSNEITEVLPDIKALQGLQVLHLGGNQLVTVPDELGELQQLGSLTLCDNRLKKLPRSISSLSRLRSLLLHKNNLCCMPVEIVKLKGLMELSLRDNPLVTRFLNTCACRQVMYNTPSLLELAARVIKVKRIPHKRNELPKTLCSYLSTGQKCVNAACKGLYFRSCVESIKFVDFCGVYRLPLLQYLCSSRCSSSMPAYTRSLSESESDEEDPVEARMKRVLLG